MATQSAARQSSQPPIAAGAAGGQTFVLWLDALADGKCDREALIQGVADTLDSSPDAGWELLALVDQYYRRHRIEAEDFRALNVRVQSLLMGAVQTAEVQQKTVATEQEAEPAPLSSRRSIAINDVLRKRYHIKGILGRGGMGTVYAASDQFRLNHSPGDQNVALKVLHTDLIKRPGLLAEIRSEFQCLQSLSHPNIVRVHEFDQDGDVTFFTMELLHGAALSRVIAEQKTITLHRPYALAMIRQIGAAVAYAHARGIVHGDLNPANIFITDSGEIRVLDFGASYRLSPFPAEPTMGGDSRTSVATPTYASCELLEGAPPAPGDDVYAIACISYVLLTGEHPFRCRNALAARKARQEPRRPAGISYRQWHTLKAGLSFDRKHRPTDAQDWLDKFPLPSGPAQLPPLAVVMSEPPRPPQLTRWIICGLIALAAGILWWAQDRYGLLWSSENSTVASVAAARNAIYAGPGNDAPSQNPVRTIPDSNSVSVPPPAADSPAAQPAAKAPVAPVQTPAPSTARTAVPIESDARSGARIELAASTVDVPALRPVASVAVHRRHSYRTGISFTWSTEPGTARPGQDFIPVKSRTEYMPAGEPETHLLVPIVADPRRRAPLTFYVVINATGEGATLGSRNITMVTIPAADEIPRVSSR